MSKISRRTFLTTCGATGFLAACDNSGNNPQAAAARIDARVNATRDFLFANYPKSVDLAERAYGILYMPLVTEIGFFYGGGYGQGALRIKGVTVDYYSVTSASFGLQVGAQQFAHVLFFMSEDALAHFRSAPNISLDAQATYATPDSGGEQAGLSTTEVSPVVAYVFGQQGLAVGVTLSGSVYKRIIP